MIGDQGSARLRCLASSKNGSDGDLGADGTPDLERPITASFFRYAKWTADGTSLVTLSGDNVIRTWVLPSDLLHTEPSVFRLEPYSEVLQYDGVTSLRVRPSCPVTGIALYPLFDLRNMATTLVLSSLRDMPICLTSSLTSAPVATYPLVNPTTESYIAPNSMVFSDNAERFIAGSDSLISTFDLSRPGQEPLTAFSTGPSKSGLSHFNPATSLRGIVSALALDPTSKLLAAGTFSRSVGIYDSAGQGECIGVFSCQGTDADAVICGGGVTQLFWSPCGRYLHVAERKSDGLTTYDVRHTGQMLGWLSGRNSMTNQRMSVDIAQFNDGCSYEIWAGGLDGTVRSWRNPHHRAGDVAPTSEQQVHDDSVACISMHRQGGVLATASGQRHFDVGAEREGDNSLRVWHISDRLSP